MSLLVYNLTVDYSEFFVFLDITSILKETPTRYELFCLLNDMRDKWYDIGLSLQVRRNILDDLKQSEDSNLTKLLNVCDNWLTTEPSPVMWETVITTIDSLVVNNKSKADLIRQYLSTGKRNKLLLLSNEFINNCVQTTAVNCIQFSLNLYCLHTMCISIHFVMLFDVDCISYNLKYRNNLYTL